MVHPLLTDVDAAVQPSYRLGSSHADARHLRGYGRYSDGWSSLIGIVTAIVGNILISFALNAQRYAHIRIARELETQHKPKRKGRRKSGDAPVGYDGTQGNAAEWSEELTQENTDSDRVSRTHAKDTQEQGAQENEPLLGYRRGLGVAHSDTGDEAEGALTVPHTHYLHSPFWWIGIVLMVVGEAGNFLAYGFAPASIVSPLGVVALISNCIIAPILLKEPFRTRDFLGVIVAVAGAVTVVLSAGGNNPKLGPHDIWALITTWEFELYLGITVGVIAALMVASNKYGEKSIFIDLALVGLFGGYTALATKGIATLLSYKLWRVLTFPLSYLLAAILVGTAIMQIKYVNRALQRFDSTQVIPTQFVMFTLSVILGSAILYRDFERTPGEDAGKFIGGCAMTFLGVWLITSDRPKGPYLNGESRSDDDESTLGLVSERNDTPQPGDKARRTAIRNSYNNRLLVLSEELSTSPEDITSQRELHRSQSAGNPPKMTTPSPQSLLGADASHPASSDESALTTNPWRPSIESSRVKHPSHDPLHTSRQLAPATPPPMITTVSDSVLRSTPHTPQRQARSNQDTAETDHPNAEQSNPMARRSIANLVPIVPSPITSPLSSSLSAIVADTLRRGVDTTSIRRRRSVGRSRLSGLLYGQGVQQHTSEEEAQGEAGAAAESPTPKASQLSVSSDTEELPTKSTEDSRSRGRSLSATLGDLLRKR